MLHPVLKPDVTSQKWRCAKCHTVSGLPPYDILRDCTQVSVRSCLSMAYLQDNVFKAFRAEE